MNEIDVQKLIDKFKAIGLSTGLYEKNILAKALPKNTDIDRLIHEVIQNQTTKTAPSIKKLSNMAWNLVKKGSQEQCDNNFCGKCESGYLHLLDLNKCETIEDFGTFVEYKSAYGSMFQCSCKNRTGFINYLKNMNDLYEFDYQKYELAYLFLYDIATYLAEIPVNLCDFNASNYFGVGKDIQLPRVCKMLYFERFLEKSGKHAKLPDIIVKELQYEKSYNKKMYNT